MEMLIKKKSTCRETDPKVLVKIVYLEMNSEIGTPGFAGCKNTVITGK